MSELTIKQENFCQKYVECGNASEAYRHAFSYQKMKDKTIWEKASRLIDKDKVATRVKELQEELKLKSDITKERVLSEFAKIGFSSIAYLHNTWIERKEFEELTADQKSAIKSISTRTRKAVLNEQQMEIEEVKVELYDKLRALESINRMLGFDAPTKTEITGKDGRSLYLEPIKVEVIDSRDKVVNDDNSDQ